MRRLFWWLLLMVRLVFSGVGGKVSKRERLDEF